MTGYESKKAAARDKLVDDRRAYYEKFDDLYAVYLNGVYDGKKAAQPAQEHVAWMYNDDNELVPLFTAPPQRPWVGLTEEEFDELEYRFARYELCRAIGAALRSKNT